MEGYNGNIAVMLDMKNPEKPEEVCAGGCRGNGPPAAKPRPGTARRPAAIIRSARGDRLYISYWHGGFAIVDISNMSKPKTVSTLDWSPPYPCPTHTTFRC